MTGADRSADRPLHGERVLIVEDRYLLASEMANQIGRLGGEVVGPLRDVAQAQALVDSRSVDVALLDVNLDGDLVYPLAETLEARGVPFAFLTGYDDLVMPERWRACPRLHKPIDPHALRELLGRLKPPQDA